MADLSRTRLVVLGLSIGLIAAVLATQELKGVDGNSEPLRLNSEGLEQLFRGDLTPEIGIGCSNGDGSSGGPNDIAVRVTASLSPPIFIDSFTYNVFTNVGPGTLDFVVWRGGGLVGSEVGRQVGIPDAQANHTAVIAPEIQVDSAQFFFGVNQPEIDAGLRLGLDTSSINEPDFAAHSYLRAPTCGVNRFATLTSISFPGNWVMAAVVHNHLPVELIAFEVE